MNLRHVATCGLVCAVFAVAGCDKGRTEPGEVLVRVVNVAPSFATLRYQRETGDQQFQAADLGFKGNSPDYSYDIDTYDFYVSERALLPTGTPRSWTFSSTLEAKRAYTFVLTELVGEVQPVVIEQPAPPAGEAHIIALHAAEGLPTMDLYLERPGVGIAGATPRGTLTLQQPTTPRTIPTGDYELFLTEAGNPANVLLASTTITLAAGSNSTFVVAPETGFGPNVVSVVAAQSAATTVLYDRNSTARLRVINGATDGAPRDFAIASQFAPPLFSAIPFADPTGYVTTAASVTQTINVTPVGNPGVLELNQQYGSAPLLLGTVLFGGDAGTLTHVVTFDDGRRIENEAKLLLASVASQFTTGLDFILTTAGGDPTGLNADTVIVAPNMTLNYLPLAPGEFDLYLRVTGTTTYAAGPTRLAVASRGIYAILAVNGPDTATAGLVLFDDFP
jgi:hypothetical protein